MAELLPQLSEWERQLLEDPGGLEVIERDVQQAFLRGAGLMIAGLVSVTMQSSKLLDAAEQTRQDFSHHAVHHVSLALATTGVEQDIRRPLYRDMRTRLRNGQWRSVVEELQAVADDIPKHTQLLTEIAYLRRHGEAGRLDYARFRRLGIPLGSGAVESRIRRVINLRLKGNGIFWKEEAAESMLQLRALVVSNRWDDHLTQMRSHKRRTHRHDWNGTPQSMTKKSEDATTSPQTTA